MDQMRCMFNLLEFVDSFSLCLVLLFSVCAVACFFQICVAWFEVVLFVVSSLCFLIFGHLISEKLEIKL